PLDLGQPLLQSLGRGGGELVVPFFFYQLGVERTAQNLHSPLVRLELDLLARERELTNLLELELELLPPLLERLFAAPGLVAGEVRKIPHHLASAPIDINRLQQRVDRLLLALLDALSSPCK